MNTNKIVCYSSKSMAPDDTEHLMKMKTQIDVSGRQQPRMSENGLKKLGNLFKKNLEHLSAERRNAA